MTKFVIKKRVRAAFAAVTVSLLALGVAVGGATAASADVPADFGDVPMDAKFYSEIMWLADQQITTGFKDGDFHRTESVSREAFAAFLYRLAGEPSVTLPSKSPFKDLAKSDQFYKEIVWLSKKGITTGWSDGTFRPGDKITREAIAAFLYRFEGRPSFSAPSKSPFKDMTTRSQFFKEVTWLAKSGMTTGYSDGTFRPKINVSREAVAAFLYRGNTILDRDGTYRVGSAIPAGTYTSIIDEDDGCYWERRSDSGTSDEGMLGGWYVTGTGRVIATISATDEYFYTDGCSGWTKLHKTSPYSTTIGEGSHLVGYHMKAGTYSAPGGSDCLWIKTDGFGGEDSSVLDSEWLDGKPAEVKLSAGQGFVSIGCGTWRRVGS